MTKEKVEITPKFSDTFRAFKECPWDKLCCVLIGQDPYPAKLDKSTYVADGLAFSSRYTNRCPKSLELILSAIDRDIYDGKGYHLTDNLDLTKWAKQGILLLNTALSLPYRAKSGTHANLWHPFISYVLKTINDNKSSIAFGLFGSYAKAYRHALKNDTFAVYSCEHPASALHNGGKWDDENIFKSIDGFLRFSNNIKIDW